MYGYNLFTILLLAAFLIDAALAVATANEAESKGRNRTGWFVLGLLTGPLGFFAATFATEKYPLRSPEKTQSASGGAIGKWLRGEDRS